MGPTEAAAIVTFWRREFNGMRVKGCVDWSTAYTLWRNMLVDYEVRWSEWNPQLHHPPTMWDWQNHTQETWETMRGRATFVLDKSLMHLWDTRPDIIAQVSTSEAATADPKDTSAFVSRPSPLDVLAAPAGRKVKQSKHKKARSIKPKQAQGGPGTESEESSEEDESEESSEEEDSESEDDDERPVRQPLLATIMAVSSRSASDCPSSRSTGVCRYYHADAPAGTTGAKSTLNKKSLKKLTKLRAFKTHGGGAARRVSSRVLDDPHTRQDPFLTTDRLPVHGRPPDHPRGVEPNPHDAGPACVDPEIRRMTSASEWRGPCGGWGGGLMPMPHC